MIRLLNVLSDWIAVVRFEKQSKSWPGWYGLQKELGVSLGMFAPNTNKETTQGASPGTSKRSRYVYQNTQESCLSFLPSHSRRQQKTKSTSRGSQFRPGARPKEKRDGVTNKFPRAIAATRIAAPQLRPQIRHPGASRSRVGEQGTLHPQLCRKGPACRCDGNHQWTQRRWPGFEPARALIPTLNK